MQVPLKQYCSDRQMAQNVTASAYIVSFPVSTLHLYKECRLGMSPKHASPGLIPKPPLATYYAATGEKKAWLRGYASPTARNMDGHTKRRIQSSENSNIFDTTIIHPACTRHYKQINPLTRIPLSSGTIIFSMALHMRPDRSLILRTQSNPQHYIQL